MKNLLLLSIFIIGLSSCAVKKKQGEMTSAPDIKEMPKPAMATMEEEPAPPPAHTPTTDGKKAVEGIDFIDATINEGVEIDKGNPQKEEEAPKFKYLGNDMASAPAPPPKVKKQNKEIFKVVEQMPRFPGCEDMQNNSREQKICTDKKMLAFIQQNLQYPEEANNKAIQGTCIVSFIIETTGKVSDIKLMRSLGGGCGEEALRVVNEMNKQDIIWTPGKQRGRLVAVRLNMPIRFKL